MNHIREHLFYVLPQAAALEATPRAATASASATTASATTAAVSPGAATSAARIAALGSKASGLLRLAQLGLSVPPAFVLGTAICREYFAGGGRLPDGTRELLVEGLSRLEEATGSSFGS